MTDEKTIMEKVEMALNRVINHGYPLVERHHKVDETDINRFKNTLEGLAELLDEIKKQEERNKA